MQDTWGEGIASSLPWKITTTMAPGGRNPPLRSATTCPGQKEAEVRFGKVALLARFEHATFWSATKRSNPLSYRSKGNAILMHKGMPVKRR